MRYEFKSCNYDLSEESYKLVGIASKELGLRKSAFVDALIKRYAKDMISNLLIALNNYEHETKNKN